ncbi:MAG TPA: hypothetical protein VN618_15160 [Solirubrobacteraceae bacterium]|nr:hypothetical protein [Solirubrobacteraceae bacterium]
MLSAPRRTAAAIRTLSAPLALLGLIVALSGCGSGLGGDDARADAASAPPDCAETVLATLGSVARRIYGEGVESERTLSAEHMIERSAPLRAAIEAGSAKAARAAARELLATGHMTNLDVRTPRGSLVSVGGAALAPLHGTIEDAAGKSIATYTTSVWADRGFSSEISGVAEGLVSLRSGERSVGGTIELPEGPLPAQGSLTVRGVAYRYTSFAADAYPSGTVRIYVLKPLAAAERLCGPSETDTQVATLQRVAQLIYEGERGPRTLVQVRRVQRNAALLAAVARRDPQATREAEAALLHHHIVRLRVSAAGKLLSDLGGPYVLAPVHADLRLHGRKIGDFVLSIQDDEGYLRLTHRLAGLNVLMFMEAPGGKHRLVKNSLGAGGPQSISLGSVPPEGSYAYRGREYSVFTVDAEAFPSGKLTIRVLVPEPYR